MSHTVSFLCIVGRNLQQIAIDAFQTTREYQRGDLVIVLDCYV